MKDEQIIALFEKRDEAAVRELSNKYGRYCSKIAWNILANQEDVEECLNDTWFSVWGYIPPKKPDVLSAFCARIVKGLAIDKLKKKYAGKRTDSHMTNIAWETAALNGVAADFVEEKIRQEEIIQAINDFLADLDREKRDIFVRRYWYLDSMEEIAKRHGKSRGSIRTSLHRMRRQLQHYLEERGIV